MECTELQPDAIIVRNRKRAINREAVDRLKESIGSIGLKIPISVRYISDDEGYELIAGHHRYIACCELGMEWIPVREEVGTELDARLWEIAENLHRADLTVLERAEHISEWIRLEEERRQTVSAQLAPKPPGRPASGINAATRELGIERTEAQRSVKIADLAPEAKEEAKVLKLDRNQSVLLGAAKEPTKEEQIRRLREESAKRAGRVSAGDATASEKRIEAAVNAAKKLSHEELLIYAEWFDEYRADNGATVFDQTRSGGGRKSGSK